MKLATYRDGSRDGQLVVVARDLALAHYASGIATRLQQVLDDWNFLSPQLQDLAATLEGGKARHAFAFDPTRCLAPLPRACQWALAPDTQGAALQQRASDDFLAPGEDLVVPDPQAALTLHAGVAVVTGDLPRGASAAQALERVRLVLLAHAWSLRGPVQPAGAFAPLAVTPDELGAAWQDGRVHLGVRTHAQRGTAGRACLGRPCPDFGEALAALARVRSVRAGSIIGPAATATGTGPVAPEATGAPEEAGAHGAGVDWQDGDLAHSELTGPDGLSVFGTMAQRIVLGATAAA
jgi:fumarylacetoacetate (FAA) hydrolase